jgi:hypothetical protein
VLAVLKGGKTMFAIIQFLVADSGHRIAIVKAPNEEEAIKRYLEKTKYINYGIYAKEIEEDVQIIFEYDNPNYEG